MLLVGPYGGGGGQFHFQPRQTPHHSWAVRQRLNTGFPFRPNLECSESSHLPALSHSHQSSRVVHPGSQTHDLAEANSPRELLQSDLTGPKTAQNKAKNGPP